MPPKSKTRHADIWWHAMEPMLPASPFCKRIGSPNQSIRLKRIAVGNAGRGVGSILLRSVLQICFGDLAANRVDLFVFVENERAYRTYLKAGFVEEGVIRDLHRDADGTFRSMRQMSMLRREWQP